jgi:uncharacterized protein YutE (UPF0331/DUF86 family)
MVIKVIVVRRLGMAPEVILKKLTLLKQYLNDLNSFRNSTRSDFEKNHYAIERIIELVLMVQLDLFAHLLSERGISCSNYREIFIKAGEQAIINDELSKRLALAAGMRNILVHLYEKIDQDVVHKAVPQLCDDTEQVLKTLSKTLLASPV